MLARAAMLTLLVGALALAGCASDDPPETPDRPEGPDRTEGAADGIGRDPWAENLTEAVLVDIVDAQTVETDIPCLNSYAIKHGRSDLRISNGTSHLTIEAGSTGINTGYQVGYSLDGEFHWFSVLPPTAYATYTVEVDPSMTETDAYRWDFYHRFNLAVLEPDCYFGGNAGYWTLQVIAHPE